MTTSINKISDKQVEAKSVRFDGNTLFVFLSDGREVGLPIDRIDWLKWLGKATPEERSNWTIEPGGFAVYWPDLDDGVEVSHILALQPIG